METLALKEGQRITREAKAVKVNRLLGWLQMYLQQIVGENGMERLVRGGAN